MLTLYYAPGACSMASHITLEEAGAEYTTQQILTSKGEQRFAGVSEHQPARQGCRR